VNKKSILLIDDEKILLDTIAHDLKKQGYDVVTARNGEEGIQKFEQKLSHLVITDLIMEGVDGILVLKTVKEIDFSTKIIVLTGYPSANSAIEALKLGASDYLVKPCQRTELLKSVEECFSSKNDWEPTTDESKAYSQTLEMSGLTPREIEICSLIKKGMSNFEIASQLFISLNTAKNHIKQIHKKLKVTNRAQLVFLLNQ
jgi:two-component system response regulator DegU